MKNKYPRLKEYRDWLVENYECLKDGFNMGYYGTCLIGLFTKSHLYNKDWVPCAISDYLLGGDCKPSQYDFLFHSNWEEIDDTLLGAIKRINYYLDNTEEVDSSEDVFGIDYYSTEVQLTLGI